MSKVPTLACVTTLCFVKKIRSIKTKHNYVKFDFINSFSSIFFWSVFVAAWYV